MDSALLEETENKVVGVVAPTTFLYPKFIGGFDNELSNYPYGL